ncbi:MAG: S-methyl-5-thioribose-1-phosphate isomerase [Deltaproteobacteria bacterium]|nr:S-methyl-5-thioribose-1-phosphate isomerase [Deltaproteobacteria bacterium]
MIRTIQWIDGSVVLIDQRVLPHREEYLTCRTYQEVVSAVKNMAIRGAPAIGIAAAMGIALGVSALPIQAGEDIKNHFRRICDDISKSRPTAVNLFWAIERMKGCFERSLPSGFQLLKQALVDEAITICREDIESNRQIGLYGREFIADGASILTHCNAGALATGGYGTALGVIRAASEEGKKVHVFVDETRPVLQGARLTAWEMKKENIPATLIADNAAGSLMSHGRVDLVIVGADRIAANGDTANKIGTYSLAVIAAENGIPFYVAAPMSTIDMGIMHGNDIPIEKRSADEVLCIGGEKIAPDGMDVFNPAFDVTPSRFITAIITEKGVATPPFKKSINELFHV